MAAGKNHITVYEYEKLWTHKGDQRLSDSQHKALEAFYGEKGVEYYGLIHKGVAFGSYVGVLQVGDTVIEILPKADKYSAENEWRKLLVDMLQAVGVFKIHSPSSSSLSLKANSILDLYFQLFVQKVEYLLHRGLVKKYRKQDGNTTALKGSLLFGKHIQQNLVHRERFFVRHTAYDKEHVVHQILRKALVLLNMVNTNAGLSTRIGSLLLDFPEVKDLKVSEATFSRIAYDRKTEPYRNAIDIARLILLNYHPDVSKGRNHVLALMFDMNVLWEEFVYVSLRKHKKRDTIVTAQTSKPFWKRMGGRGTKMRPDVLIKAGGESIVLDTKWKNLNGKNPTPDDLRQMYVYHQYFDAKRVALVYPGTDSIVSGNYFDSQQKVADMECSLISIPIEKNIKEWQKSIAESLEVWADIEEKVV